MKFLPELLPKEEREVARWNFSTIALKIAVAIATGFIVMPEQFQAEIPTKWLAWIVLVLGSYGWFGVYVKQKRPVPRMPRRPKP